MEEETAAIGAPSPLDVDPSIPPPARSLDEMSPAEMKAKIQKLEQDLASRDEQLLTNVSPRRRERY
jgi:hypothetical protein